MSELVWYPHKGWGFEEGTFEYGDDYWEEFRAKDDTPIGKDLTELRAQFVRRWKPPSIPDSQVVDVGIGGGAFVEHMGCYGTDVNQRAIAWLRARKSLWLGDSVEAMTFWDSLEHIRHPYKLLDRTQWAFVSTPIYESAEHCIRSKHYKPGEHLWYFTAAGLTEFLADLGFELQGENRMEESCGRVDIGSYAFVRA